MKFKKRDVTENSMKLEYSMDESLRMTENLRCWNCKATAMFFLSSLFTEDWLIQSENTPCEPLIASN